MITEIRQPSTRRWGRQVSVAAGAAIAGAAIPLLGTVTAQADATSDATIGVINSIEDTTIANIGNLSTLDTLVSPIAGAIDAAQAPINAAQALLDAVPTASLSPDDLAVLMGQQSLDSMQLGFLDSLQTFQEGLTFADPAYLASLDTVVLAALDNNVLEATQAFISSLSDPTLLSDPSSLLDLGSTAVNLLTADFGMALGDASTFGASLYAELAGLLGISLMP